MAIAEWYYSNARGNRSVDATFTMHHSDGLEAAAGEGTGVLVDLPFYAGEASSFDIHMRDNPVQGMENARASFIFLPGADDGLFDTAGRATFWFMTQQFSKSSETPPAIDARGAYGVRFFADTSTDTTSWEFLSQPWTRQEIAIAAAPPFVVESDSGSGADILGTAMSPGDSVTYQVSWEVSPSPLSEDLSSPSQPIVTIFIRGGVTTDVDDLTILSCIVIDYSAFAADPIATNALQLHLNNGRPGVGGGTGGTANFYGLIKPGGEFIREKEPTLLGAPIANISAIQIDLLKALFVPVPLIEEDWES